MSEPHEALRRTALHDRHVALGAKMVGFSGWEMALSYPAGTVAEHRECRSGAVAFDVSHLGTVRVEGSGAPAALQSTFTNDLTKIGPGRAQYTHLLDAFDGSVTDDIIVWWRAAESFDVMPNASNTDRVTSALSGFHDAVVTDVTEGRTVVAVQGPRARDCLAVVAPGAAEVGRFRVASFVFDGVECAVAGTGYTGEDGVECAVPNSVAGVFWDALLAAGVRPAGLGARDTLRLEAALPLHGHELGPGITPLQAGLGWVVAWSKGEFRGRAALRREFEAGVPRRLVGVALAGRQPAREGASLHRVGSETVLGTVTSGNFSPTLDHAIALTLVSNDAPLKHDEPVELDVRGRRLPGRVVELPFVAKKR